MDLFTAADRETFTRDQVLVVLNAVRNDPDFFEPMARVAYDLATAEETT